jgi:hypothetical protein
MRRAGVRAVQSTPIVSPAGRLLGMFSTHYPVPNRPADHALRYMSCLAQYAADIMARLQPVSPGIPAVAGGEQRERALPTASKSG